jgi:hypothetical protein
MMIIDKSIRLQRLILSDSTFENKYVLRQTNQNTDLADLILLIVGS